MIGEFINWWAAQLLDLVPARFKTGYAGEANALVAEVPSEPGAMLHLWLRRNHRETPLGHFTLNAAGMASARTALARQRRPGRVLLRAPIGTLLERQVVLPLAAERDRLSVLRYEMDRLTPFTADEVFWTGTVERRDPARGKVTLLLSMIPKAALMPVIGALREAGLAPAAIEAPLASGGHRMIGVTETRSGGRLRGNGLRVLAGACAVLALIAIVLPFAIQSRRAAAVEHEIAVLRPRVARAEALRRRILAGAASSNVIAHERAQVGDPLAVLTAVTNALPDNTFLTEMTLTHLKLNLAGQSAAAAPLLSALSADPMLKNAAFSAPVTRDSTDHEDLFSIEARVDPAMETVR